MKRILVVKLSAMGDIVHCLPAVVRLQNAFPGAAIDWLVESKHRMILDQSSLKVRMLPIDTHAVRTGRHWGGVMAIVRQIQAMRAAQYDCAIDFQGLIKSAVLAYLSGAPRRIGFSRAALREPLAHFFYTEQVTPRRTHITEQLQELLVPLEAEAGALATPAEVSLSASDAARMRMHEKFHGVDYLLIHPGGGWPTKRWPLERFNELARRLAARGMPVVMPFAPGDKEGAVHPVPENGFYRITATLDELIALCAGARLFVGGDSGPLHIAATLKKPIVALFGPTASERNGPTNQTDIVVEHTLPCRPCYKRNRCPLGHWNCMEELSVEEVYQACLQRLEVSVD